MWGTEIGSGLHLQSCQDRRCTPFVLFVSRHGNGGDQDLRQGNAAGTLADSIAGENMTPQEITTALQTFNKRVSTYQTCDSSDRHHKKSGPFQNALPVSRVELSPEEQQILWSRLEKLLRDHKEARQTILNTIKILS